MLLIIVSPAHSEDILTCGWNEVRALQINETNTRTLWTWAAINSSLPESFKPLFGSTSECKPIPGGKVLITSSIGAVALVDRASSNVLFYARVPMAHSAEMLPSNRVVVASAFETNGNRLVVFNLGVPDVELFSVPLGGAHGVVWDEQRQILWGLSGSALAEYKLTNWNSNPGLVQVSSLSLPDGDGHDLYPVPNSPYLVVTTALHCWLFNRDTRVFTKHPLLGDIAAVKSISVHPTSGRIVYVQADGTWWSEHLRFLSPSNTFDFPGDHFYKARWIPPEVSPQLSILQSSGNMVRVSWASTWTNYSLQQNTTYNATNWAAPAEPVSDDGTNKFILVNPSKARSLYRLLKT